MKNNTGLFITATDTGVGKTTIARQLIPALEKQGLSLCIRKPVESGCFVKADQLCPQDAAILADASQTKPALADVCPYRFQAAASPARAAQLTGTSLTLDDLAASCNTPEGHFLIVEGAGSFYSPLTSDNKLNADLAQRLNLPLLLITPDRLGCIGHTLLTLEAARRRQLKTLAVVLNTISKTDSNTDIDNSAELSTLVDIPVVKISFDTDRKRNQTAIQTLVSLSLSGRGLG